MQGGVRILSALLGVMAGCTSSPVWTIDYSDDHNWYWQRARWAMQLLIAGGQPGTSGGSQGRSASAARCGQRADYRVLASPQPGMLWWVHAAAGARGCAAKTAASCALIRRGRDAVSRPHRQSPTLYGIWAFSDGDVWAVGGESGGVGVVLHGGRGGFAVDSTVPSASTLPRKLWANDPEHLFVVGQDGTLLRRVRQAAALLDSRRIAGSRSSADEPGEPLLIPFFAVGGLGTARLLRFDGQLWQTDAAVAGLSGLPGCISTVSCC